MRPVVTLALSLLDELTDAELLEFYREVSRRASTVRAATPEWRQLVETGKLAAAARDARERQGRRP